MSSVTLNNMACLFISQVFMDKSYKTTIEEIWNSLWYWCVFSQNNCRSSAI